MTQTDIAIVLIIIWAGFRGWRKGFLKEVISAVGFFAGLFIAYFLYDSFSETLFPNIGENASFGKAFSRMLVFVLLWIVSPIVLGAVANMVTKGLKGLHMGFANSALGVLVAVFKYIVLMSFVVGAVNVLGITDKKESEKSVFYKPVAAVCGYAFEKIEWKAKSVLTHDEEEEKADTVWIPIHGKK